mgnify:FL=1
MRAVIVLFATGLACQHASAQALPARTHAEIIDFVVSAGLAVCESVPNAPDARASAQGVIGKHLVEVAEDCARRDAGNPDVIFAFEFDTTAHRDAALEGVSRANAASFMDYASTWPIGERGAVFVAGPARDAVGTRLQDAYAKRKGAAGN